MLFSALLGWSANVFVWAQAQPTEHQLKAAVIGNIAKFVDWPTEEQGDEFVIGILGQDPFGTDLETVLSNVKVRGKSFSFIRSESISELLRCQIVFVSARENARAVELIQQAANLPILTVGEESEFLEWGGAVSLSVEGRKIQLSINLEASDRAGLTVNPQLLRLAKTVKRKDPP